MMSLWYIPTNSEVNHLLMNKFNHCSYKLVVYLGCLMLRFFYFWGYEFEYAQIYWHDELCTKFVATTVTHRFQDYMNYSWIQDHNHSLQIFSCITSLHMDTNIHIRTKSHTIWVWVINEDIIYRESIAGWMKVTCYIVIIPSFFTLPPLSLL